MTQQRIDDCGVGLEIRAPHIVSRVGKRLDVGNYDGMIFGHENAAGCLEAD